MIDLHSHSTASDGSLSPTELVRYAAQHGISVLALTDHDSIAGIPEAEVAAKELGIRLIRGIELEIASGTGTFHLLGLGLDEEPAALKKLIDDSLEDRRTRNALIVEKMNALGIAGSLDDVANDTGAAVLGRPHFAQYLVQQGHASDIQDAFDRHLGHGKPLYEPRSGIDLDAAVAAIRESAGVSIVAHPVSLRLSWAGLERFADECLLKGVDGLEAFHPSVTWRESQRLVKIAQDRGLRFSGGSDFHRPGDRGRMLGKTCKERRRVPADLPLDFLVE